MEQTNPQTNRPYKYQPKIEFETRMNELLKLNGSTPEDIKAYWEIVHKEPVNSIRCNTLKNSPEELKKKLEIEHKLKISQPFKNHPEIMIIESNLLPGQLGKNKEHLLGYYYVQEISSMMSILALKPTEEDSLLDLCASPGSKTTQAAMYMKNKGNILANEPSMGRMVILASNLERCGISNTIITRKEGTRLCQRLKKIDFQVNKILVDAPCSGEGTLRSSPKTFVMWNEKLYKSFSNQQKALASNALELLQEDGEMIYSTCTHAPEENEEIIQYLLDNYDIKIEDRKKDLPIKTREGITNWKDKIFSQELKKCVRIYPQDNNTEGFFICKMKKLSNKRKGDEE
ncbi:MAG: RsmB/NOP family class I SAM-dependent RNA methyltransferase [archaeon]|nr:RsmB/NOP family class I SAM-dependent RNA methyltransferase [archaeon]